MAPPAPLRETLAVIPPIRDFRRALGDRPKKSPIYRDHASPEIPVRCSSQEPFDRSPARSFPKMWRCGPVLSAPISLCLAEPQG